MRRPPVVDKRGPNRMEFQSDVLFAAVAYIRSQVAAQPKGIPLIQRALVAVTCRWLEITAKTWAERAATKGGASERR